MEQFAVVDVETTGFARWDRVVEIAVVSCDQRGEITDEYVTLVQPERDVGPVEVHGITAAMAQTAPSFHEVAGTIAQLLHDRVVVAHNAPFDLRFLSYEYERVGARIFPGEPLCTMQLGMQVLRCGGKLADMCARLGIEIEHAHSALHDARATASLFRSISEHRHVDVRARRPLSLDGHGPLKTSPRTMRRGTVARAHGDGERYLARVVRALPSRPHDYSVEVYLRVLDDALADLELTSAEAQQLDHVAEIAGLSAHERAEAHAQYFDELVEAALRDGVVTDEELAILQRVGVLLDHDPEELAEKVRAYRQGAQGPPVLSVDARVCFTGDPASQTAGGGPTRQSLEARARDLGLVPVGSVTKNGCDLLVAADPATRSGKAQKARQWGIPIVSVEAFLGISAGDLSS